LAKLIDDKEGEHSDAFSFFLRTYSVVYQGTVMQI
jgi:hypothetical protein